MTPLPNLVLLLQCNGYPRRMVNLHPVQHPFNDAFPFRIGLVMRFVQSVAARVMV